MHDRQVLSVRQGSDLMAAKMARQSGSALGGSGYTPYGSAMPPPVQPEPTFVPAVAPPPPPEREQFPFGDPAHFEKDVTLPAASKLLLR